VSSAFAPQLSYVTAAGWTNSVDTPTIFKLDPASSSDSGLILWSKPAIADGCGPTKKRGVGSQVSDFVDFVSTHPGIQVLSSASVKVGSWSGRAMDLRLKPTWTGTCAGLTGP